MKRPLIRCVVVLLAALLIALTVGRFWVGRYAVATRAMQPALRPGDRVAVDKRGTPIRRGAIVLYRSPRPQDGDALHFGRCVGLPGDTVTVTPDGYLIHGRLYPAPADLLDTYRVPRDLQLSLLSLLFSLDIPIRHLSDDTAHFCLCLTSTEAHRVRELLPRMLLPTPPPHEEPRLRFILPAARQNYAIDAYTLRLCGEALLREAQGRATLRAGRLYLNGHPTDSYRFRHDHYWILADNPDAAIDSRHLGPIPRTAIIGTVVGR